MLDSFWTRLRSRPLWGYYLRSFDFLLFVCAFVICWLAEFRYPAVHVLSSQVFPTLLGFCFGLLAINVAVLAVLVSFSQQDFFNYLSEKEILRDLLFVYEYANFTLLLAGVDGMLFNASTHIPPPWASHTPIAAYLYATGASLFISLTVYSFANFWAAMTQLANFGYRRDEFIKWTKEKEAERNKEAQGTRSSQDGHSSLN